MAHPTEQYESRRQVSSTIVAEEWMGEIPEESVTVVEVETIEEIIKHVPKIEIVEIEKRVPKYDVTWVERTVEVPKIEFIDRQIEVPQIEDVVRHITKKEIVDVPKEIIRRVPVIQQRTVEKVVEVQGEVIEVPKPYAVERAVEVPVFEDFEQPLVVGQVVRPVIVPSDEEQVVELLDYVPRVIPVDVQIPKPVSSELISTGMTQHVHRVVDVPMEHYNALVKALNPDIDESLLPLQKLDDGRSPMLQFVGPIVTPDISEREIMGFDAYRTGGNVASRAVAPAASQKMSQRAAPRMYSQIVTSEVASRSLGQQHQHVVSSQHPSRHPSYHLSQHQSRQQSRFSQGSKAQGQSRLDQVSRRSRGLGNVTDRMETEDPNTLRTYSARQIKSVAPSHAPTAKKSAACC